MILTNVPMRRQEQSVWGIAPSSLSDWRVEEAIRYIKQAYDLEDVRVRTYGRLRNMKTPVMAKRFFGVPDFRHHAIAEGIRELLQRHPRSGTSPPTAPSAQLSLALL